MGNESKTEKDSGPSKGPFSRSTQRRLFLFLFSSVGLISVFQNCAPGKIQTGTIDPTMKGFSSLAQCPEQPSNSVFSQPEALDAGNRVSGFYTSSAVYPQTCNSRSVTRTCLESGKWDGDMPIFSSCAQLCIHPESTASNPKTSVQGEHYVTYSKNRGQSKTECDAARTDSVCNSDSANPGAFFPAVPVSTPNVPVYKTCVIDPICSYTNAPGRSVPVTAGGDPDRPRPMDTVVGYINPSETYPNLCGMPKKMTCKATGEWDLSAPYLNKNCEQSCYDPVTKKPVLHDTSVVYWSKKSGSQKECDDAMVTSSCQAVTGTFNPALPVMPYAKCEVVNPPNITMFAANPGAVLEGGSVTLNWNVQNFTKLTLYDEKMVPTDVSNLNSKAVTPSMPMSKYMLVAIFSSNGFDSTPTTAEFTVLTVKKPTPAKINAFDPNPAMVTLGESTTLSWSVMDGTVLSFSDGVSAMDVSLDTSIIVDNQKLSAVGKYNFTLTAYHQVTVANYTVNYNFNSDPVSETRTVTVRPTAPKINTFTVDSPMILASMGATLSWNVTDGNVLTLTDITDPLNPTAVNYTPGSLSYQLTGLTKGIHTYELKAIHRVNMIDSLAVIKTQTVEVVDTVSPPQILKFAANPANISTAMVSTLSWDVLNGTIITLNDVTDPVNPVALNFATGATSYDLVNLVKGTHTYELTAIHSIGMTSSAPVAQTVTVIVVDPPTPPVINSFTATPSTITSSMTTSLAWDVVDGTVITLTDVTNAMSPMPVNITAGATSIDLSALSVGDHTYELKAIHRVNMMDSVAVTSQKIVSVIAPPTPATISSFSASPATIVVGSNTTLSWAVSTGSVVALTEVTDPLNPVALTVAAGATSLQVPSLVLGDHTFELKVIHRITVNGFTFDSAPVTQTTVVHVLAAPVIDLFTANNSSTTLTLPKNQTTTVTFKVTVRNSSAVTLKSTKVQNGATPSTITLTNGTGTRNYSGSPADYDVVLTVTGLDGVTTITKTITITLN